MLSWKKKNLLPRRSKRNKGKKLLVLDLDETLIHSTFGNPFITPDFRMKVKGDKGETVTLSVQKRPYVDYFLRTCSELFEICVFTAGTKDYAKPLIDFLDRENLISHRLYRKSCTIDEGGVYLKDLSRLGRRLSKTIIVDNSPKSFILQPKNGMEVKSWYFDRNDRVLLNLVPTMKKIAKERTVYKEVKRYQEEMLIRKNLEKNMSLLQRQRRKALGGARSHRHYEPKKIVYVPHGTRDRNRKLVSIKKLNMDSSMITKCKKVIMKLDDKNEKSSL